MHHRDPHISRMQRLIMVPRHQQHALATGLNPPHLPAGHNKTVPLEPTKTGSWARKQIYFAIALLLGAAFGAAVWSLSRRGPEPMAAG